MLLTDCRSAMKTDSIMKRLTVIVPTYNMEALLPQCLDSILQSTLLAAVEVIVVNDGSNDGSLGVARDYERRYPDVVRVIDKPNGNYGSTVNVALPIATGEYVRLLDADDCFDVARLGEYIEFLQRMSGVDMVVSPFVEAGKYGEHYVDYDIYSRRKYEYGVEYDADKVFGDGIIRFFMMHSVAYRTELLREMGYRQSEGISYTDQEWVFYPLFHVRSIAFADIPLYRYNLAREGQTMDYEVQLRSIGQLVTLTENMATYFAKAPKRRMSATRVTFLREIVKNRMRIVLRKYLLEMSNRQFASSDFVEVYGRLLRLAGQCGIGAIDVPVNNRLKVDLLERWLRYGHRHSAFSRFVLRNLDSLMTRVYVKIFRRMK